MTTTAESATASLSSGVQRYFEVALYLLVLTGFGTLASTGELDLPTVLFVGCALLLRGYLLAARRNLIIHERWTTVLTVGYVAFYLADYFLISRSFLDATVHLVLFVMVVRLFSTQRDRDYYFLSVIAFLMVLASAVLTVNSVFLLTFAGFMLMAVATFILMEMRQAAGKAAVQSKGLSNDKGQRRLGMALSGTAPVLALFIFLAAGAIFFVLPRISAHYLGAYAMGNDLSTGFSDRVELGRIGQIQQSNSLVMHVLIDGDTSGAYDLKWRGVTLSVFDGRNWFNPHEQHVVPRLPDGALALWQVLRGEGTASSHSARPIHYRVMMEPVGTNVFFLAVSPRILQGAYRLVTMDSGGAVFDLDPEHPINRYEATSNLAQPDADELRHTGNTYPAGIVPGYLQLPPLDPRIAPLAQQITAQADNNYDKARALENYLRTHYGYTLQLSRQQPRDPLAEFLFERRQGHCEYFASAMAVMLRTLGIPSRVANGFRTGEFNDLTSQYLVRAKDAHSWVEVYFPGYGWMSFDPTPAAALENPAGWGRAMLYIDAAASFWREWVINYDASHQSQLGHEATRNGLAGLQRLRDWGRRHYESWLARARRIEKNVAAAPGRWTLWGALAVIMLGFGANAGRVWRMLRRRRMAAQPEKFPRAAATIWYERMTREVERLGWRKSATQTPGEFAARIENAELRTRVAEFTRHYECARFGDSAEAARRLPELFEEVSTASR